MATALPTPPHTPSARQWWLRQSTAKQPQFVPQSYHHTATKPTLMTSITSPKSTPPNAFMPPSKNSSRFNLASVIGFGSKSKKQQPVDIQDPPALVRSIPPPASNKHFSTTNSTVPSNPRFSRGVASSRSANSRASRASTEEAITPADELAPHRISYQHSLMTLTDFHDPFAPSSPLNEHRLSTHSDRSISKRFIPKLDNKATRSASKLPVGEVVPKRKDSRDRSATLPPRIRTADSVESYQPLRAVEAPWASKASTERHVTTSHIGTIEDNMSTLRAASSRAQVSKSSTPPLSWTRVESSKAKLNVHQRTSSSSSLFKDYDPDITRPTESLLHASAPSSTRTSTSSLHATSPPSLPPPDPPTITTSFTRSGPRPPPTTSLPPTPQGSDSSSSPSLLHPSSPIGGLTGESPSLRSRPSTASAISFTSSLSSLSFNSKPSPHEAPPQGKYGFPNLMHESLPGSRSGSASGHRAARRHGTHSGSPSPSRQERKGTSFGHTESPTHSIITPKAAKAALPVPAPLPRPLPRPLPSPPAPRSPRVFPSGATDYTRDRDRASEHTRDHTSGYTRERALSATSSTFSTFSLTSETRILRKQRSFHNTSIQALTPNAPALRHYASFDPSAPPSGSGPGTGTGGATQAQVRSPPLPPLRNLPPLPPPLVTPPSNKRASTGKDSLTSPRRKLFGGGNKHERDREKERKQDAESMISIDIGRQPQQKETQTQTQTQTQALHHSSSWFDDATMPESASSATPQSATAATPSSTAPDVAQHIVPPAELLRLGAEWEPENQGVLFGARRAKSSWGSRESDHGHGPKSYTFSPSAKSARPGTSSSPSLNLASKLPRSASLHSKATSSPSFSADPSSTTTDAHTYTSLSPPPRRTPRAFARAAPPRAPSSSSLPSSTPPHRTLSNASSGSASSRHPRPRPRGALVERKPSFLDMSARQSVSLVVPERKGRRDDEPERDSFLELSRGMDSIDTIRESAVSVDSLDSFMQ